MLPKFIFRNIYYMGVATNYVGTTYFLRGCLQDLKNFITKVVNVFKVPEEHRYVLMGKAFTVKAVKEIFLEIVGLMVAGDLLLLQDSSHGTDTPDLDGDEKSGKDQALVAEDGLILDDEIFAGLKKVPAGCLVIGFFDCCRSGSLDRSFKPVNWHYIPEGLLCSGVLYFGCKEDGTSADAYLNRQFSGAFTTCALEVLEECDYNITYKDLLDATNKKLLAKGFEQTAQMACTPGMEDKLFGTM